MKKKIFYGKNLYDSKEILAVTNSLKKGTQASTNVRNFENKVSSLFSKKNGLMVNSGSSANTLALESFDFAKGSNIITPLLTFSTTISPMVKLELIPNFVDINLRTLNIDEDKIEQVIDNKTVALMIPNLIGNLPNYKKIKKICHKYNLKLIEDSADTIGGNFNKSKFGHYSDVSTTSFYGSHVISCAGNGGMVSFKSKEQYLKAKVLRGWGRESSIYEDSENINNRFDKKLGNIIYDKKFIFSELGYNFEPSEVGAAFGMAQLSKLNKFLKMRKSNFAYLKEFFSKHPNEFITPFQYSFVDTAWLSYPIIINEKSKIPRHELQIYLEKSGIQTRPIFSGNILMHPGFKNIKCKTKFKNYKNTDYIMRNGILIGCHQALAKNFK